VSASAAICYAALAPGVWFSAAPAGFPGRAVLLVTCEFLAGGMLFGVYSRGARATQFFQRHASVLFLGGVGLVWVLPVSAHVASHCLVLLIPPILLGLTSEFSIIAKLLSTKVALWLGRLSFALYMTHAIAEKMLRNLLPARRYATAPLHSRMIVLFANGLLIFILAVILYYAIELPARDYMRGMAKSRGRRGLKAAADSRGAGG
jgi:peptidoglycan/LPS O-acetylase OafA/YrhL